MDTPGWTPDRRKTEFSVLNRVVYLDHARRGPALASAVKATTWGLEAARLGALALEGQREAVAATRRKVATLMNWKPQSIAFVANTTAAIAAFAQAVSWRPGDRVLSHADEVASNLLPWQDLAERGVKLDVLPSRDGRLDMDDLGDALRAGGVRVVSLAAVALDTGERRDLAAIGRLTQAHGCLFCVDAAQGLGALSLDLAPADVVFGSGRKWLLGPPDVGILAIRPGVEKVLGAPTAGELSRDSEGEWMPGAGRFEGGALPTPIIAGLGAAVDLQLELGTAWIEARVLALSAEVAERAEAAGYRVASPQGRGRSGIVQLVIPGAPFNLELRLRKLGVVARTRNRRLRVSAHFWNTSEDLDRLFEALTEATE